jgi:hypothetical protein
MRIRKPAKLANLAQSVNLARAKTAPAKMAKMAMASALHARPAMPGKTVIAWQIAKAGFIK